MTLKANRNEHEDLEEFLFFAVFVLVAVQF
jgi:hypothetical protein